MFLKSRYFSVLLSLSSLRSDCLTLLKLLLHASLKDEREAPLSHAMYDEDGENQRQMKDEHTLHHNMFI